MHWSTENSAHGSLLYIPDKVCRDFFIPSQMSDAQYQTNELMYCPNHFRPKHVISRHPQHYKRSTKIKSYFVEQFLLKNWWFQLILMDTDENGTCSPDIKRTTTVASRMSDCHGNRTAIGCFNHNMLIAFLLNISGGKCLEIISVENIKMKTW